MLKRFLYSIFALAALAVPALAQFSTAEPVKLLGLVVSVCNGESLTAGNYSQITMDQTGAWCATASGASVTLTANSTATSGFSAGNILMSDGSKLQVGTNVNATSLALGAQQTTRGYIVLDNTAAGAFATTLQGSNSASAAWTLTLPTTAGTSGYALTTDGSGVTSWSNIGTGPFLPLAGGTMTGALNDTAAAPQLVLGANTTTLGAVKMFGSTSGDLTINPAAVAGTASKITFPAGITDFSATGAANAVVKQNSAGAPFTVGTINCAFLSDSSTGCSTTVGTIATQAANNVAITGGAINGTTIGGSTRAAISGTTGNFNGILTTSSGIVRNVRVVTAAGNITMATTDDIIVVNKTVGAPTAVNLVGSPTTGTVVCIKDGKGDANSNNITLTPAAGNIDGSGTYVMNVNYQNQCVAYNGSSWNLL